MTGRPVVTYARASYPRSAGGQARQAALTAARRKALERLVSRHMDEFTGLYRAEVHARGERLPALERACECGGRVRRRTVNSRWPKACDGCAATEAAR